MFQQFNIRVKHDNGIVTIRTAAQDENAARRIVMASERCPARSILSVKVAKPVKRYPTKSELTSRLSSNNVECFYIDAGSAARNRAQARKDGAPEDTNALTLTGWYFWTCLPGCMPDSDPFGPYGTPLAALRAAYDADFLPDTEESAEYFEAHPFSIVVSNLGTVFEMSCTQHHAESEFSEWCEQTKAAHGRASGESVTLFKAGEIVKEHAATNDQGE